MSRAGDAAAAANPATTVTANTTNSSSSNIDSSRNDLNLLQPPPQQAVLDNSELLRHILSFLGPGPLRMLGAVNKPFLNTHKIMATTSHGNVDDDDDADKRYFFTVESPNNKGRIKQRLP